eukprot:scaffold150_cov19-Tisochrysis_lutea.AAC.1
MMHSSFCCVPDGVHPFVACATSAVIKERAGLLKRCKLACFTASSWKNAGPACMFLLVLKLGTVCLRTQRGFETMQNWPVLQHAMEEMQSWLACACAGLMTQSQLIEMMQSWLDAGKHLLQAGMHARSINRKRTAAFEESLKLTLDDLNGTFYDDTAGVEDLMKECMDKAARDFMPGMGQTCLGSSGGLRTSTCAFSGNRRLANCS